ncbi:MAG TPA: SDR family oxidoreductase, partial [Polyangiaceae bacterium]|nr:SDR family oxidoreductase [Polyangiaceae bacterium]
YGVYAGTKAAVEAMTSILAKELRGRSITVNAVAPGPTATDLLTRQSCRWQPCSTLREGLSSAARLVDHRFQNPWDGIRNARLKREEAFSHAMIIVSSAIVSSS